MTIAEEIRIETTENNIFDFIKGLWKKGIQADIIADVLLYPSKK